jgi:hypothetical protein
MRSARPLFPTLALVLLVPARAEALPTETIVFLNSEQKVLEKAPNLSLFGFFFSRNAQSVLGVYAGPRWKLGDFGVEGKLGVYGGDGFPAKAIFNTQVDYALEHLSVTSFTDWYPPDQVYSYLSTFLVFGPLYVGGVADVTIDWSGTRTTKTMSKGPSVGLGTKNLYLGTSYILRSDRSESLRMTVGITL